MLHLSYGNKMTEFDEEQLPEIAEYNLKHSVPGNYEVYDKLFNLKQGKCNHSHWVTYIEIQ